MSEVCVSDRYFSLIPERQCGECMICCEYMYINAPTLKKPADVLCENCVVGQGCSIYETRPSVCRTWHCLWRRDASIPDELRPDKSGVIFSLKICYEPRLLFENAHIVCMALKTTAVFDSPMVAATIDRYIEEGSLPVWLSHGGCKNLAYPNSELADAIVKPKTTAYPHLVNQGQAWLSQFENLIETLQVKNARFCNSFANS